MDHQKVLQQTQQHRQKQLLEWVRDQRLLLASKAKLFHVQSFKDLSNGTVLLQIIQHYHPKKVDLSKSFLNPKDQYETLQNFKLLSQIFGKLGWGKLDPEKYRKKRESDIVALAQNIKNALQEHWTSTEGSRSRLLAGKRIEEEKLQKRQRPPESGDIKTARLDKINKQIGDGKRPAQHESSTSKKVSLVLAPGKSAHSPRLPPHPTKKLFNNNYNAFESGSSKNLANHLGNHQGTMSPEHKHLSPQHPSSVQGDLHQSRNLHQSNVQLNQSEYNLSTFQNIKISKLQKQKSLLLRKISQIQNIVLQQKWKLQQNRLSSNSLPKQNGPILITDQSQKCQNDQQIQKISQQPEIQRIKQKIVNILTN